MAPSPSSSSSVNNNMASTSGGSRPRERQMQQQQQPGSRSNSRDSGSMLMRGSSVRRDSSRDGAGSEDELDDHSPRSSSGRRLSNQGGRDDGGNNNSNGSNNNSKRPKRTYRACLPCRSRKLKCDLGDPDAPSEGPCKRCRRESRDCVFKPRPVRNFELPRGAQSASSSGTATPDHPSLQQHQQQQHQHDNNLGGPPSHLQQHQQPPPIPTSVQAQMDAVNAYAFPGMVLPPGALPNWASPAGLYSPHHAAAAALMTGSRLPSPGTLARGTGLPPYFIPSPLALPTRQLHPLHSHQPPSASINETSMAAPPPPSAYSHSHSHPHPHSQPRSHSRPGLNSRGSGSSEHIHNNNHNHSNMHGSKRKRAEDYEPGPIDEGDDDDDDDDELEGDDGENGENAKGEPIEDVTLEEAVERARGDGSRASSRNRSSNSRVLLSSTLHNPSDALRLLATASSLRSTAGDGSPNHHQHQSGSNAVPSPEVGSHPGGSTTPQGSGGAALLRRESHHSNKVSPPKHENSGWASWPPIAEGLLSPPEAEVLFSFFETEMAPLYPLLSPNIFHASHLSALTSTESLLLSAMVTIAARYSSILLPARAAQIHSHCAAWIRQELIYLLDGSSSLRHTSSVEALLLLTEWPSLPLVHRKDAAAAFEEAAEGKDEGELETSKALKTSAQYDSMSWTYLGLAVRLAQELGMHNTALYGLDSKDGDETGPGGSQSWQSERILRTWIYCYNADRHVSVRLGRNAVVQAYMSSAWWEKVTQRASLDVQKRGLNELWAERTLPQGLLAALMGTIQERLFPNKEITRSLLRTGHWENFIRSLDHELRSMASKTKVVLRQGNVESALLRIEIDYVRLYGNAIALRALQERLRRRVKANDLLFVEPTLLNLQEGPWIIDALAAAQEILQQTVTFLEPKGYLRLCPSRIFQRIMFAATFLFKALAVGVVEHGQSKTIGLLEQGIAALRTASVDAEHISRGFSVLLTRLQAQCIPALLAEEGLVDPTQPSYPPSPQRPHTGLNGTTNNNNKYPNSALDEVAASLNGPHPQDHQQPEHGSVLHEDHSIDPASAPDPTSSMKGATPSGGTAGDSMSVFGETITMHGAPNHPSHHQHHHHQQQHAQSGLGGVGGMGATTSSSAAEPGTMAFDLPWQWDPSSSNVDVGKEQDVLFASMWMNQGTEFANQGEQLGLFGTLMGDDAFS